MAHPYLAPEDLIARVGGAREYVLLTDDDKDGSTDAGVQEWIQNLTDSLTDGYALLGGYTVPLDADDVAVISPFLLDIANYKLRARGTRIAPKGDKELHDAAMKVLGLIGSGGFLLPSGGATDAGTLSGFAIDSQPKIFTRTKMRGF